MLSPRCVVAFAADDVMLPYVTLRAATASVTSLLRERYAGAMVD